MSVMDVLQRGVRPGVIVPFVEPDMSRHLRDVILAAKPGDLPLAVAYPTSTQEVSSILRICDECRVAVVPQGGAHGARRGEARRTMAHWCWHWNE